MMSKGTGYIGCRDARFVTVRRSGRLEDAHHRSLAAWAGGEISMTQAREAAKMPKVRRGRQPVQPVTQRKPHTWQITSWERRLMPSGLFGPHRRPKNAMRLDETNANGSAIASLRVSVPWCCLMKFSGTISSGRSSNAEKQTRSF
jgi:hypothetical protein